MAGCCYTCHSASGRGVHGAGRGVHGAGRGVHGVVREVHPGTEAPGVSFVPRGSADRTRVLPQVRTRDVPVRVLQPVGSIHLSGLSIVLAVAAELELRSRRWKSRRGGLGCLRTSRPLTVFCPPVRFWHLSGIHHTWCVNTSGVCRTQHISQTPTSRGVWTRRLSPETRRTVRCVAHRVKAHGHPSPAAITGAVPSQDVPDGLRQSHVVSPGLETSAVRLHDARQVVKEAPNHSIHTSSWSVVVRQTASQGHARLFDFVMTYRDRHEAPGRE